MKLRMQSGSIRLRLKQAEVRALAEGNSVEETICAEPVPLIYALVPDTETQTLAASFDGSRLNLRVPKAWLAGWDTDSRVGFEGTHGGLALLVEKDWKCIHPAQPEDNADCFENPAAVG